MLHFGLCGLCIILIYECIIFMISIKLSAVLSLYLRYSVRISDIDRLISLLMFVFIDAQA